MHSLAPLKIGYFADGIWAHNALKKLIADTRFQICFITPRFLSTDQTLHNLATTHHIPYIRAQNINSVEFMEQIKPFECDIFVSMSFNQIFKPPLITLPRLQTINCHAGKLPFYRGRNILNWALINDEKEFGITIHYVDEGIDTGDIILQKTYPITDSDTYSSLLQLAHEQCAEVLFEALCLLQEGKTQRIKQDSIHQVGFYCPARIPGDEWINWHQSSRNIFNFIRALNTPDLGAKTQLQIQSNKNASEQDNISNEVRIFSAKMIPNAPCYTATPGVVINNQAGEVWVKTLDTMIALTQYESNHKLKIGDRFSSSHLTGGGIR